MTTLEVDVAAAIGSFALRARLDVPAGTPTALVGPNDAGKTSLLLATLGIVRPSAGRIALGGEILFDAAAGVSLPPERRGIGYVPQNHALFPHMTVRQNVEFALACRGGAGVPARDRRALAAELLGDMELGALADRRPPTLSGGESQRVALARALAAAPRALLLDEPLAALDVGVRRQVRGFVAATLARLDVPALVVTHDLADAAAIGARVAVLDGGKLVQVGTIEELRARPGSAFVEELVREAG